MSHYDSSMGFYDSPTKILDNAISLRPDFLVKTVTTIYMKESDSLFASVK